MGYPVIKVTEVEGGIHVRQDRFLESGPAKEEDNQTVWYVPRSRQSLETDETAGRSLSLSSLLERTGNPRSTTRSSWIPGKKSSRWTQPNLIRSTRTRQACVRLTSLITCPFIVSPPRADRVLYSPDTTAKISAEAAKPDSAFSLNDRIGLVLDSVALAQAGFSNTSSMFTLIDGLKGEKECRRFLI